MGWGTGIGKDGREIGYMIEATCDHPGCEEKINRGLAFLCGGPTYGSGHGCAKYFCEKHMGSGESPEGESLQVCVTCEKDYPFKDDEDDE